MPLKFTSPKQALHFCRQPKNAHITLLGVMVTCGVSAMLGYGAKLTIGDNNLRTWPRDYKKRLEANQFKDMPERRRLSQHITPPTLNDIVPPN